MGIGWVKTCTEIIIVIKWAASSEFVSSSIPSWQILTAYAQPFRGARDLAFCLKVPLDSLLVWASSEGSGETARMRRLAWTFAARTGDKYQIRLTRPKWYFHYVHFIHFKNKFIEIYSHWRSDTGNISRESCKSDKQTSAQHEFIEFASLKGIFPVSESQWGLINILHYFHRTFKIHFHLFWYFE